MLEIFLGARRCMAFTRTLQALRIGSKPLLSPSLFFQFARPPPFKTISQTFARSVSIFSDTKENLESILIHRDKPNTISYFAGNWQYSDLLIRLDKLIEAAQHGIKVATQIAHDRHGHRNQLLFKILEASDSDKERLIKEGRHKYGENFAIRQLWIRSFNPEFFSLDLAEMLSQYGQVETVQNEPAKYYAHVTFTTAQEAIKAMLGIENELGGKLGFCTVKVEFSKKDLPSGSHQSRSSSEDLSRAHIQPIIWKSPLKMSQALGIPLKASQYRTIIGKLNTLARIPHRMPVTHNELSFFSRAAFVGNIQQKKIAELDEYGRAYTIGKRKEAIARIWVIEGNEVAGSGHIMVNGRHFSEYFDKVQDQEEILLPLNAANLLGKYNIWCTVEGGGPTGQSGAIKLGIGKALLIFDANLKSVLRKAGCITRDPRVVERKKPGLVKARKAPTWVKR